MVKLSIVLTAVSSMDDKSIERTLSSIKNQTFNDFEVLYSEHTLENEKDIKISKTKIMSVFTEDNNPNIYVNKVLKQSNGKYIYFMKIGDEFSDTNIISNLINQLEKDNSSFIQYHQSTIKKDYPKNYREDLINIHTRGMIHESIFQREHLLSSLDFKQIKNKPYYELILLTYIMLNTENYIFTDKIISGNTCDKIEDLANLTEYLTELSQITKILLDNNKIEYINFLSQNLPEIDYNKIKITDEEELTPIKEQITNINKLITKEENGLAYYYFNKYFRCIKDVLYNDIQEFDISISIIIPTYNAEEYLFDCINSILNQKMDDIEIICVDDVSTDSTRDILNYYSKKYFNICSFFMKEKHGSGGCRNYGLKYAKGKYIYFMDSDDWLDLYALKNIHKLAQKYKTQILMFKNVNYTDNKHEFHKGNYFVMESLNSYLDKLLSIDDIKRKDIFDMNVVPWNKLYLKSFLDDIDVKFVENLIHQDNPFFYETIIHAERIYFIDEYYYNYRIWKKSITQLKNEVELGVINIIEYILIVFIKNSLYSIYKKELLALLFRKFNHRYDFIHEDFKEEFFIRTKKMINKFINEYNLADDLNNYLAGRHKNFYESVILADDYETFTKLLNK